MAGGQLPDPRSPCCEHSSVGRFVSKARVTEKRYESMRIRVLSNRIPIFLSMVLLTIGCADDDPIRPDVTPPTAVTDLRIGSVTDSAALLIWTATGNDGDSGTASEYDVRYCNPLTACAAGPPGWDSATHVPAELIPKPAGQPESLLVLGLVPDAVYSFALRAADADRNWSEFSNVTSCTTYVMRDTIPPAAVMDLKVVSVTYSTVTLSWTAPGDDGDLGDASEYELRYSTSCDITAKWWSSATPVRDLPRPSPAGGTDRFTVPALEAGTMYCFAVKTGDEVPNWSAMSIVASCATAVRISPDEEDYRDAEILALVSSGRLLAPPDLVEHIAADLAAIRSEYPHMKTIRARPPWVIGEVLVRLTNWAWEAYLAGAYDGLDDLNEQYGPVDVSVCISRQHLLRLEFGKAYNPRVLSYVYDRAEGVEYAQPNHLFGDGPGLTLGYHCRHCLGETYVFREAWGDCPSGCIYEHVWVFRVDDGRVELIEERERGDPDDWSHPGD